MAISVALDDARAREYRIEGDGTNLKGGSSIVPLFGSPTNRSGGEAPQAFLSQGDPSRATRAHFHALDQFQIVMDGTGRLGRHDLIPYSVHFARAYTPYGPLVADAVGMTHLTLRAHHDPKGALRIPEKQDILLSIPNRKAWQVFTSKINFPSAASDASLQPIPEVKDEHGLAAYTLTMKPNGRTSAPDASRGDGQYLLVVKGSLMHDSKEHKAIALVFIGPSEGAYQIHAGPTGLEALVLNFPQPQTRPLTFMQATPGQSWQCAMCQYVYDQLKGLPAEGIKANTQWQHVPANWNCPNCGSPKDVFKPV